MNNTLKKMVSYVRVSTRRQLASGLGLEAQQATIDRFCESHNGTLIATYTECESGKRTDRPKLAAAIAHAKRSGALLVVAKIDRLARNLHFLTTLMESGVEFVACDNPSANRLTCHILAAVAESERITIAERVRSALAAAKARGTLLGASLPQCRNLTDEARQIGRKRAVETIKAQADAAYSDLVPEITERRQRGETLVEIATALNTAGHTTRRGAQWTHKQVRDVLLRFSPSPA